MRSALTVTVVVSLAVAALPADAQWLKHPTPSIPRTSDGKPNLAAPAPRGADGHPDLSGPWLGRSAVIDVPDEALTAQSRALIREREENYFRDRPAYQCRPSGPDTPMGWRRIIQSPAIVVIVYDNLTYRLIFMDGRTLEADPERTWMGHSVGRWEGDRWSWTASGSTIAHGWMRAACRTPRRSARPSGTGGSPWDVCSSSSP